MRIDRHRPGLPLALVLSCAIACSDASDNGDAPTGPPGTPRIDGLWLTQIVWTTDLCNARLPQPAQVEITVTQQGQEISFGGPFVGPQPLQGVLTEDGSVTLARTTTTGDTSFSGRLDASLNNDRIVGTEEQRIVDGDQVCLLRREWTMDRASEFAR